ncbi:MAG: putative ATP-dependent helicase Lhr [Actinobacteria bacterium]|nr:putative ATP-dependent helicase Lhr [Actinomycetota bacterium]
MELSEFHPLVARWFTDTFGAPTPAQSEGWGAIAGGRDTLIAAPTGSGKTLAAFLWAINELVTAAAAGELRDETSVVYVSPLKALGNDIHKNLTVPLAAIRKLAEEGGTPLPDIRMAVRSGDTPAAERNLMVRKPPHILITTPESLYILLTAERSRAFLANTRAVIVDEIHAVAGDKRGSHLALTLERLDALDDRRRQRIGLSATQKPIEDVARLLAGTSRVDAGGRPDCAIVDVGHRRDWDLAIHVPGQPLGPIASHEMWDEVYDRMASMVETHRSTLVFVNTRRLVERVSHQLEARLGEGKVGAHHGSLSRKTRLAAEEGLKSGSLRVVVATASLELGIDVGHVDLVCHLGAPRALATLLQRIGRSGHWLGGIPKGVLFPLTRDELVQSAAAVMAARAGELDRIIMPAKPLDILAQQIVATAATGKMSEESLWDMARRAYPYRDLTRKEFDEVIEMLSEGFATKRGRSSAHLHRDQVNGVVSGRRGARLAAITSGGAIPDTADYDVIAEPEEVFVGKVNEDFAIESMAGDIFLLGNTSWRIRRVESGKVRVEDAKGAPSSLPFWLGEAPARTAELSRAVSDLRAGVAARLGDPPAARTWLMEESLVDEAGAAQIVDYIAETVAVLGVVPTVDTVVAERFFDEAGGMQLVLHTPFGGRINRAWGLSLRKRFCVNFDFELQATATDDGVVLSLGEQHSFPLDSVFSFLRPQTLRDTLVQAMLPSPMFGNRWRWNATRGLALLRRNGGRKVPAPILRMRSDDLLAAVFPDQVACQENRSGPIEPPDHPLVNETILNCLHEAMDLDGLIGIVEAMDRGEIRAVAVETPAPSPMSHELLNANPYAFLDDAPLEERRARAVSLRRTDPELAGGVGALSPAAIEEVREDAWPDVRDADELHDHLLSVGLLPEEDAAAWTDLVGELFAGGRVLPAAWEVLGELRRGFVAAERVAMTKAVYENLTVEGIGTPGGRVWDADDALKAMLGAWMACLGPVTAAGLAARLGLPASLVDRGMLLLEGTGMVLRGHFTAPAASGAAELEWCDRRLLSRIHRLTLRRLRAEIEPVSPAVLMRFLLRWGHVAPGTQMHGKEGLTRVIGQLQGLELPAPAWEERILPARIQRYNPADLEHLCLSGVVTWGRLNAGGAMGAMRAEEELEDDLPPKARTRRPGPVRNSPLAFVLRDDLGVFLAPASEEGLLAGLPSAAREVAEFLAERGASFLPEITKGTGRLPTEVEDALWDLVSAGLVSGDGVAGLRLLLGRNKPPARHTRLRAVPGGRSGAISSRGRPLPAGRWSLWRRDAVEEEPSERDELVARQLLRRYGVVFRDLLARERNAPPWRVLLPVYRRLEARGEIRGGRFVNGFVGEQFALPEAIESLRAVRRSGDETETIILPAADPLNLVGIIVPGQRVSPFSTLAVAYRNGVAIDVAPLGTLRSRLWGRESAAPAPAQ